MSDLNDRPERKMVSAQKQAAAAADAAEIAMVKAREKVATQKIALRVLRGKLADQILIWQGFSPKRDVASLVRENSLRERARKLAQLRGEIPADEVQEVRSPSHLDAILNGGRGTANRGYKRPFPGLPLGSRVAVPKLPSER